MSDDFWAWAVLILCQVVILIFAELTWWTERREPIIYDLLIGGGAFGISAKPQLKVSLLFEKWGPLSIAWRANALLVLLGFFASYLTCQQLVFPGHTYLQIAWLGRVAWFVFWIELYAGDVWLCQWLWKRYRELLANGLVS